MGNVPSDGRWKGTPSGYCFEPHQPVGTVAALDNSSEELNYDQVPDELKQNYFVNKTSLTSDSEPWVASRKRRKMDSDTVTIIVTVKTTFNDDYVEIFKFPISLGLLILKNIVAQRFKLKSNRLRLKYIDKENDLILIACDKDLQLAVDTTAINNRINLICLPCAAGWLHNGRVGIIQPNLESVADNFGLLEHSLDAESLVATGSTDAGEKSRKKRKTESDLLPPVIGLVTANITYKQHKKVFQFFISSGLSYLENQVARSFKLEGKELRLKYRDEDDDLILVALDVDLKLAVLTAGGNNTINLICVSD